MDTGRHFATPRSSKPGAGHIKDVHISGDAMFSPSSSYSSPTPIHVPGSAPESKKRHLSGEHSFQTPRKRTFYSANGRSIGLPASHGLSGAQEQQNKNQQTTETECIEIGDDDDDGDDQEKRGGATLSGLDEFIRPPQEDRDELLSASGKYKLQAGKPPEGFGATLLSSQESPVPKRPSTSIVLPTRTSPVNISLQAAPFFSQIPKSIPIKRFMFGDQIWDSSESADLTFQTLLKDSNTRVLELSRKNELGSRELVRYKELDRLIPVRIKLSSVKRLIIAKDSNTISAKVRIITGDQQKGVYHIEFAEASVIDKIKSELQNFNVQVSTETVDQMRGYFEPSVEEPDTVTFAPVMKPQKRSSTVKDILKSDLFTEPALHRDLRQIIESPPKIKDRLLEGHPVDPSPRGKRPKPSLTRNAIAETPRRPLLSRKFNIATPRSSETAISSQFRNHGSSTRTDNTRRSSRILSNQQTQSDRRAGEVIIDGPVPQRRSAGQPRRTSPPVKIPSSWKMPFDYPPEGSSRATVYPQDLHRLNEGEFLNDNLIDFYMRYLQERFGTFAKKEEDKNSVYVFSTYFHTILTNECRTGEINYDAVARWTNKEDIFSKDVVIVPINESSHWYMAVIFNLKHTPHLSKRVEKNDQEQAEAQERPPESIDEVDTPPTKGNSPTELSRLPIHSALYEGTDSGLTSPDETGQPPQEPNVQLEDSAQAVEVELKDINTVSRESSRRRRPRTEEKPVEKKLRQAKDYSGFIPPPCIFMLDSLGRSRNLWAFAALRRYITAEALAKKGWHFDGSLIMCNNVTPLPTQGTGYDCGIYLLYYTDALLRDWRASFRVFLLGVKKTTSYTKVVTDKVPDDLFVDKAFQGSGACAEEPELEPKPESSEQPEPEPSQQPESRDSAILQEEALNAAGTLLSSLGHSLQKPEDDVVNLLSDDEDEDEKEEDLSVMLNEQIQSNIHSQPQNQEQEQEQGQTHEHSSTMEDIDSGSSQTPSSCVSSMENKLAFPTTVADNSPFGRIMESANSYPSIKDGISRQVDTNIETPSRKTDPTAPNSETPNSPEQERASENLEATKRTGDAPSAATEPPLEESVPVPSADLVLKPPFPLPESPIVPMEWPWKQTDPREFRKYIFNLLCTLHEESRQDRVGTLAEKMKEVAAKCAARSEEEAAAAAAAAEAAAQAPPEPKRTTSKRQTAPSKPQMDARKPLVRERTRGRSNATPYPFFRSAEVEADELSADVSQFRPTSDPDVQVYDFPSEDEPAPPAEKAPPRRSRGRPPKAKSQPQPRMVIVDYEVEEIKDDDDDDDNGDGDRAEPPVRGDRRHDHRAGHRRERREQAAAKTTSASHHQFESYEDARRSLGPTEAHRLFSAEVITSGSELSDLGEDGPVPVDE